MKVVIIQPNGPTQNLEGLKSSYLSHYIEDGKIKIEEEENYVEVTCPDNFVNGIISFVECYGYVATEYGDVKSYG